MKYLFKPLSNIAANLKQDKIVNEFYKNGFSIIKKDYYDSMCPKNITQVLTTYEELPKDDYSKGNRYRAYSRYNWCSTQHVASLDPDNNYFQAKNYNPQDGDKVRKFSKISHTFLENPIVKDMFIKDVEIARKLDHVKFNDQLEIGLHQIRYKANQDDVAYSSPSWLHRDDEPVVFVHVYNFSSNMVGGDNVIADQVGNRTEITRSLRLKCFETILLSKKVLHAVTPLSSNDEKPAVRDILLVTFQNKKNTSTSAKSPERVSPDSRVVSSVVVNMKKDSSLVNNIFTTFYKNTAENFRNIIKTPAFNIG